MHLIILSSQANCVLEMMEQVAPDKVSSIILKSNCFKEYKKDKVSSSGLETQVDNVYAC